ncbi:hypothetical protein OKW21_000972 [Catalinimonas alkaloidigena]|nr:hypothetical protein [Catalinimonas alkaloidigena]
MKDLCDTILALIEEASKYVNGLDQNVLSYKENELKW